MPATTERSLPELLYLLHGDPAEFAETLTTMRAADVAEALNALYRDSPDAAAKVLSGLPFDLAVQVLDDPDLDHKAHMLERMEASACSPLLEAMSSDQQAELFRSLPNGDRNRLLRRLAPDTQRAMKMLLAFPATTAGGIMTTEFVSVPSDWTAEQTLQYVKQVGGAKETVYAIYVLDVTDQQLLHVISLREVIMADRERGVLEVGDQRTAITVKASTSREEVARLISRYNLLAVPVLDHENRVIGIVTVDDVIDAIVQETTEDAQKFSGVATFDEPYMSISMLMMVRKRVGWLAALFIGEMLTATALGRFEHEIERAVVLALFIPLIISSGGNSGGQSTSLIIRAMALGEVRVRDWWRVARRDLPAGLILGSILGSIAVARILIWQFAGFYQYGAHYFLVALTVGASVVGVVTFGSLTGSMLPFLIKRVGLDPATASAPFVATLVDVTGIVIYFTVASIILHGTLL